MHLYRWRAALSDSYEIYFSCIPHEFSILIILSVFCYNLTAVGSFYILQHDDIIKWKYCPRYWPFVRGIRQSPVNTPHKGQWRGALMFFSICAWTNGWVNNRDAGDLRHHRAHYGVTVMRSNSLVLGGNSPTIATASTKHYHEYITVVDSIMGVMI